MPCLFDLVKNNNFTDIGEYGNCAYKKSHSHFSDLNILFFGFGWPKIEESCPFDGCIEEGISISIGPASFLC